MKVIQDREVDRIKTMILSQDKEMRLLACKILGKKEKVRLSFGTLIGIHGILMVLFATGVVYVTTRFDLGWYWVPMTMFCLLCCFYLLQNLVSIGNARAAYNSKISQIKDP